MADGIKEGSLADTGVANQGDFKAEMIVVDLAARERLRGLEQCGLVWLYSVVQGENGVKGVMSVMDLPLGCSRDWANQQLQQVEAAVRPFMQATFKDLKIIFFI